MGVRQPYLSIVIKALNEEQKIARAIESALAVAAEIGKTVEVVVADSVSTDRTVAIACEYPVRVVQFANSAERGCGAGVQLGYQHSRGEFVYFLDGDMEIAPGFMSAAFTEFSRNPKLGGVGGRVEDTQVQNDFDRIRVNNRSVTTSGFSKWLEGGGLYRRMAIDPPGRYAADRNLRGFEEAELGMRIRSAGWQLLRLPIRAVSHTGHSVGTMALFARHWRSRRAMSAGVLLRGAASQPWLTEALRMLIHPLATAAWWAGLMLLLLAGNTLHPATLIIWVGAGMLALIGLALRKRDLRHAVVSVFSWHYGLAAIVAGIFEHRIDPATPIASRTLADATGSGA